MLSACIALALARTLGPGPAAEEGVQAFAEGRYEDAAAILERAYAEDPRPELLFAWAQAERYAGHCEQAVPLYRRFLALPPAPDVAEMAREAVTACGEDPEAPAEPESDAAPSPEVAPAAPPSDDDPRLEPSGRSSASSVARDPWGHGLVWSGLAFVGAGTGLLVESHRRESSGMDASDEQAYRDALSGAPAMSRAGVVVVVGGTALLVAGVVRFAVLAARGRRRPLDAWQPTGRGLVWKFELAPRRARALR